MKLARSRHTKVPCKESRELARSLIQSELDLRPDMILRKKFLPFEGLVDSLLNL